MASRDVAQQLRTTLRRLPWFLLLLWTGIMSASLGWNLYDQRKQVIKNGRLAGQVAYENDVLYRKWAASHGGIYVPMSERTPPNPYLDVPHRDLSPVVGPPLTLVNPAYMTRQINEMAEEVRGTKGHITSLNPIRPENAPDPWERAALEAFERGEKEVCSVDILGGKEHIRFMRPFVTEKACLTCHAAQGYKEGDIRGGVSVSVPTAPLWAIHRSAMIGITVAHGGLWLLGIVGIVLSTRKLRAGEEQARWLARFPQENPNPVVRVSTDGIVLYRNRAAANNPVWRCRVGRPLHQEALRRLVDQSFAEGREIEQDLELGDVPYAVAVSPIPAEGYANLYGRDITDRKRTEKAFRESRADLAHAQAVAHCGSWRLNVQRNELIWSDENWRLFGLSQDTVLTYETFLDMVHPDDRAYVHEKWSAALRGEPYDIEHRIVVGEQIRWVRERAELEFDSQGALLGGFGTTQDITEKKHAEEALAAAKAAAEAANKAKGRFLANISHELRTPMNAVLGMIDLALPKTPDPTVKDCLRTARSSADLLLTLLNDLLDSSKIEAGKLELEAAPFSLRRMLQQATSVLSVRASEKGLAFCCQITDKMPDAVIGDRLRLQQVILNLAGNAIKFTERGNVEIRLCGRSDEGEAILEFAVQDTGIGISPSDLKNLFQPFAQADRSMTRRFGGTGLGLSISKTLVERMGGTIRVESALSEGSTFTFVVRLPLASGVLPEDEFPAAIAPEPHAQLRVLLVEDNPANQKLVSYILRDRGHSIDIASDGQQAIEMHQQGNYDAILMDVQMPAMDGLEATAAIRKREESGSRIPIVAMTAHAMNDDCQRCLDAGMDGYLSKPINAHEMIGLVEGLVQRSAGMAETVAAAPASTPSSAEEMSYVFDAEMAVSRCFNRPEMARQMIHGFLNDVEHLLPQMRAALDDGNLEAVGQLGHRIKGTVVYLGAERAGAAALRVEDLSPSRGGMISDAEEAVNALEQECLVLRGVLAEHPLARDPGESTP